MPEDLRKFAKRVASVSKGGADEEQEKLIRQYQEEYDKQFAEEEKRSKEDDAMREAGVDPEEQRRLDAEWSKMKAAEEAKKAAEAARMGGIRKSLAERDQKTAEQLGSSSAPVRMLAEKLIPARKTSPETDSEAEARYQELAKNESYGKRFSEASANASRNANKMLNKVAEMDPGSNVAKAISFLLKKRREPTKFTREYEE